MRKFCLADEPLNLTFIQHLLFLWKKMNNLFDDIQIKRLFEISNMKLLLKIQNIVRKFEDKMN